MHIDLNSDLGEGCPHDAELLTLITSANIACGWHAGDASTASATLAEAVCQDVVVGAHPSFPDRDHFGRQELQRSPAEIFQDCVYQIGALAALARAAGTCLAYIKAHGALYNMACRDDAYARPLVDVAEFFQLPLLGLPRSRLEILTRNRIRFVAEGFADRRYQPDGTLVPRERPDAFVHDAAEAVQQAIRLVHDQGVETLCVHGDNPQALVFVRALRGPGGGGHRNPALGMSLRVLEPGLCSLIVDHGRPHSRSLGIPVGGAADRSALAVGNAMLGNPAAAAALEITLVGPGLVALQQVGAVVVGAPFQLSSGRQALAANRSFTLEPAEELHVGGTQRAARAYLCVVGGFQTPLVLGSRSSLAPLQGGIELQCTASTAAAHFVRSEFPAEVVPSLAPEPQRCLRVIPGPQVDWFPHRQDRAPFAFDRADCWTVSPASNRMGLRLRGPALPVPQRELVSEPVAPGAIQVMPDGQAIVLGVDGQTIGGYPKVAQVISADLDLLGQLRPGDRLSFETVTVERAQEIYRARAGRLEGLYQRLRLAAEAF